MINYFNDTCLTCECSAGNFWCMWSPIKSYLMVQHRLDIRTCPLLCRLLIKVVLQDVKHKSNVFKKGVTQIALQEMHDDENSKELADKIECCLLIFGLHCRSEMLETQAKDVKLNGSEEMDFFIQN